MAVVFTVHLLIIFIRISEILLTRTRPPIAHKYSPEETTLAKCVYLSSRSIYLHEVGSYLSPPSVILGGGHFVPSERTDLSHQHYAKVNTKGILIVFLLQWGDVHPNPGPASVNSGSKPYKKKGRQPKHPCTLCDKNVTSRSKAVHCFRCENWTHVQCTGYISDEEYKTLSNPNTDFTFNFYQDI